MQHIPNKQHRPFLYQIKGKTRPLKNGPGYLSRKTDPNSALSLRRGFRIDHPWYRFDIACRGFAVFSQRIALGFSFWHAVDAAPQTTAFRHPAVALWYLPGRFWGRVRCNSYWSVHRNLFK